MAALMLQGCRCDGYAEQQTRLEGIVPGGLAAGGLSNARHNLVCLLRCYPDALCHANYNEVYLLRPWCPDAARVYFAPACGLSLALDTAPKSCPGEPLVPAADLLDGG